MQNTTTTEVIKPTNLNFLFQDQIVNFAHLVTTESQTKEQFINTVKTNYSETNPKTSLFIQLKLRKANIKTRTKQNYFKL